MKARCTIRAIQYFTVKFAPQQILTNFHRMVRMPLSERLSTDEVLNTKVPQVLPQSINPAIKG